MDKFRLPRRTKKLLKKTLWLYPPDEQGSSLMAFPSKSETDYIALKKGIVREFPERSKAERKIFKANLDKEIYIDDRVLKTYVNELIREDLRYSFYQTLLQAKNNKKAIQAYFNFINAYHLYKDGKESYGNICCLAVERARELLKTPAKHRRRK